MCNLSTLSNPSPLAPDRTLGHFKGGCRLRKEREHKEAWRDRTSDRRDADEDSGRVLGLGGGGGGGGATFLALCHIEVWEFTLL